MTTTTLPPRYPIRDRVAAVAWSLAYLILGYVGTTTLYVVLAGAFGPGLGSDLVASSLLQATLGIAVFSGLSWLVGRRAMGMSRAELGWASGRPGVSGFGKGLSVGLAIGALALVLGWPAESRWRFDGGSFAEYLGRVGMLALVLTPAALFEEIAFRGVFLSGLARGIGRVGALILSSALFALAHRANPSVTPLALGNIGLAGVFLGLSFYARGGLWTATGAHVGWNLVLAALAAPVSGLPFEVPWIDFSPGEPSWVTGGRFGPEGGLLASLALSLGIVWVWRWQHTKESA